MRLFILLVALIFWLGYPNPASAQEPPRVTVSIKPIHSLTTALMKGVAVPALLFDGEQAPYFASLSAEDQQNIAQADLLIWTGPELEPAVASYLKGHGSVPFQLELLASEEIKVLPARYDPASRDPFFWLDVRNAEMLIGMLSQQLIKLDPARADLYEQNRRQLNEKISRLEREMEYAYRDVSWLSGYLYHDTQYYFAQAYGFRSDTILSPSPTQPANLPRLLATLGESSGRGGSCLFTEAGLDQTHLALLAQQPKLRLVELDSLGVTQKAGPELYEKLIRHNFFAIRNCLLSFSSRAAATTKTPNKPDSISPPPTSDKDETEPLSPSEVGGRFLLMDQNGQAVLSEQFAGQFMLVFFGYTNCPDICPNTLYVVSEALALIGTKAKLIQPLFITVDPERDSAEALRGYMEPFHPTLLALTGQPALVKRAVERFKVRYEKVPLPEWGPEHYAVNHTASLFLMGQDGKFITKFAYGITAEILAKRLSEIIP
ncbi:MAG: SCO family protein [Magnetococcales bacterium]|nr:SCO family protein [Magnetococcales bacterium]